VSQHIKYRRSLIKSMSRRRRRVFTSSALYTTATNHLTIWGLTLQKMRCQYRHECIG